MNRRNLQNDNKINKTKKSGFFDYGMSEEEDTPTEQKEQKSEKKTAKKSDNKRFRILFVLGITVIVLLLVATVILSCIDFFSDGELNGSFGKNDDGDTKYHIVKTPDWETDIYTVPEYLELDPDAIMYNADGVANVLYYPDDIQAGTPLAFIQSYFDAIKQGDHKKLNSLFSESCLQSIGEYSDFPMQKVYNIQVKKLSNYVDNRYEGKVYDYQYFSLTYNIYKNDGLFCDEVDETRAREEGILVVFDKDGNAQIEIIRDLKNYK